MALNLYLIEKLVHFGRANGKEQVERKQPVHRVREMKGLGPLIFFHVSLLFAFSFQGSSFCAELF